jgi:hypothetical protein
MHAGAMTATRPSTWEDAGTGSLTPCLAWIFRECAHRGWTEPDLSAAVHLDPEGFKALLLRATMDTPTVADVRRLAGAFGIPFLSGLAHAGLATLEEVMLRPRAEHLTAFPTVVLLAELERRRLTDSL